jgi:hypothetical protein
METHAIGKRAAADVSGDASTPRASHLPEGTTDTAEVTAGALPTEGVAPPLHQHEGERLTAALTDTLSQGPDRQATFPVTEGRVQASRQDAEAVRAAFPVHLFQLLESLQELSTRGDLAQCLRDIPPECYDRVDQCLAMAFDALTELRSLWQKHRREAPVGLGQLRAPQRQTKRARTPTTPKAKSRQSMQTAQAVAETALSQPDLLLRAIRTAPQPLTIQDVRQLPGVDGRRVKRNVARLVAQGKIQETPAGYGMVSV